MKKHIMLMIITAAISSILIGCGASTASEKIISDDFLLKANEYTKDFNTNTNQLVEFHGCSFEVPESWSKEEDGDDLYFFYPDNGMLMVSFEKTDMDILDSNSQEIYVNNIASGCDYFEMTNSDSYIAKNREGFRFEANVFLNDKKMIWDSVTFPTEDGVICLIMGTYVDGSINYVNDYLNIFASISFDNYEGNGKQQASMENTRLPEKNTSEMVDYLIRKAQSDVQGLSDEELVPALDYINDNIDNCWDSNEIMENYIYYGSMLEIHYNGSYANADIKGRIGMNAVQLVKYVYRNTETIDSDHTQENLRQVKEDLETYYMRKK